VKVSVSDDILCTVALVDDDTVGSKLSWSGCSVLAHSADSGRDWTASADAPESVEDPDRIGSKVATRAASLIHCGRRLRHGPSRKLTRIFRMIPRPRRMLLPLTYARVFVESTA
jgi:hypothetical protein